MEIKITEKIPLERAIKILKKKLIEENIFKELKQRQFYEKPSERKKRKEKEAKRLKQKFRRRKKKPKEHS